MSPEPQLTAEQRVALEEKLKNLSPKELRELQKEQCVFCQIVSGKVPSKKIYEDNTCIAILDINPAAKGHLLLLPKEHYAIMPQLPQKVNGHLFVVAKSLSKLLLRVLRVTGTTVFIANGSAAGQHAQHFMIHLIPRVEGDGLLTIEERLIDFSTQQKVKTALQNRINELLGVSAKVVDVSEKENVGSALFEEAESRGKQKKETGERQDEDREEPEATSKMVKEELPSKKESSLLQKTNKSRSASKKRQNSNEPDEEDGDEEVQAEKHSDRDENEKSNDRSDADLDAIANLFK